MARLMGQQKLAARCRSRRVCTTDSKHGLPVASNVLNRDFRPQAPNRTWAKDITYVWTVEGWLYLREGVERPLSARLVDEITTTK
ncbi:hypothetical protein SAMN05443639_12917 [Stigmatella erecta]|uniref:Transposase n=1 Tax=Stigmatella erecta TaxID=83460 RepID=A0A1I0LH14_9BACT|nr:hypothetical protein SAMN05443639_12917 [Stigmatella erecta]